MRLFPKVFPKDKKIHLALVSLALAALLCVLLWHVCFLPDKQVGSLHRGYILPVIISSDLLAVGGKVHILKSDPTCN